jgi:hypothetical protein
MKKELSYLAYGLLIRSAFPLPELMTAEGRQQVVVRPGKLNPLLPGGDKECENFLVTKDGICLFWKKVGKIFVREGREIIVDPAPEVDEGTIRLFILGPALGAVLHQRGRLVLHGSAVTMHGETVAFLGEEETGKSTLAAALYVNGYSVVADDLVALQIENGSSKIFPSAPRLKLSPHVVSFGDFEKTHQISYPSFEIRSYLVDKKFSPQPLYLKRIYILGESEDQKIERLPPQEALMELIRHSYCARLISDAEAPLHLLQCATLVNRIPIFRLKRPRSISSLPDVVRMVEKDLASN